MIICKRHWIKLGLHTMNLYFNKKDSTSELIKKSYNSIAENYDTYWTTYMNNLSDEMIKKINPSSGESVLDLTCGTGYVTSKLAEKTKNKPTGVDISKNMINIAKENYRDSCNFIVDDIHSFLKNQKTNSKDIITCAWGLGYIKPKRTINEISRILRPGGRVGIIDNSLMTNWEPLWFLLVALAEKPNALTHRVQMQYLLSTYSLKIKMIQHNLKPYYSWNGSKKFQFKNGKTAIKHWINSGAAAGFTHAIQKQHRDQIMNRVSEMLDNYYGKNNKIPLIHRYIAAIAYKPEKSDDHNE